MTKTGSTPNLEEAVEGVSKPRQQDIPVAHHSLERVEVVQRAIQRAIIRAGQVEHGVPIPQEVEELGRMPLEMAGMAVTMPLDAAMVEAVETAGLAVLVVEMAGRRAEAEVEVLETAPLPAETVLLGRSGFGHLHRL